MTPADDLHTNPTSSLCKKRQHVQKKVNRPPPLVRKGTHNQKISHKPTGSRSSVESTDGGEEDPPMATTFQQFCATCDKQIVVPNASILYCSERCRRQDSQAQSLPLFKTDISPPPSPYTSSHFDNLPIRDIVPQRSPTNYNPNPPTPTSSYHSISDTTTSSTSSMGKSRRPSAPRTESEAARYLAQFGSLDSSRHRSNKSSTALAGESIPSLSHTPNSLSSASTPYTPQQMSASSQRTQSSRVPNPRWSSTSFSSRTVDLVTPISHISSFVTVTGEHLDKVESVDSHAIDFATYRGPPGAAMYEKRSSLETTISPGRGSLKQLFRFEEMRSQPMGDQQYGVGDAEALTGRKNS